MIFLTALPPQLGSDFIKSQMIILLLKVVRKARFYTGFISQAQERHLIHSYRYTVNLSDQGFSDGILVKRAINCRTKKLVLGPKGIFLCLN